MKLPNGLTENDVCQRLDRFQIETPSWGYADTGTRFGKFLQPAAAGTIQEKLADAGIVHKYTGCCPTVAVHVLFSKPSEVPESWANTPLWRDAAAPTLPRYWLCDLASPPWCGCCC